MILPQDILPEKSLYVIGGRIIQILDSEARRTSDPKNLYDRYVKKHPEIELSYNYFLYALDWLFLLNLIKLTDDVKIEKCYLKD